MFFAVEAHIFFGAGVKLVVHHVVEWCVCRASRSVISPLSSCRIDKAVFGCCMVEVILGSVLGSWTSAASFHTP